MRTSITLLAVAVLVGTLIFTGSVEAKGSREQVLKGVRWCKAPDMLNIVDQDKTGKEYGWLKEANLCGTFSQSYRVRVTYTGRRATNDPVTGLSRSLFAVYRYRDDGKELLDSRPLYIAREDDTD
jgi:hypothetical protein